MAGCKIKVISRGFIATSQTIVFIYNIATLQIIVFNTICDIAKHTVNSLKITLILQLVLSDVKIGPLQYDKV